MNRSRDPVFAGAFLAITAIGCVAVAHRATDGAVLANAAATWSLLGAALAAVWLGSRRSLPRRSGDAPRIRGAGVLALAAAVLVMATWWGDPGGPAGDYTQHRMYTHQLLNGFAAPHAPYAGVPGHYTFLPATAVAVLMHATGLSFHYAAMLLSCAVSAGVALLACDLAAGAGLRREAVLLFGGLVALYGGAWWVGQRDFFLYLPGVQLSMPYLSRNLALLLALLGLRVAQAIARDELDEAEGAWLCGTLVGLLGLTRPWEFALGAGLLAAAVLVRGGTVRRAWLGALAVGCAIASAYYAPLLAAWWELGIHAPREVARPGLWPTAPGLFLPLLPLVVLALGPAGVRMRWVRGTLAVLIVLAALLALGQGAELAAHWLRVEAGLFKLERLGQWFALPLFALAAAGTMRLPARAGAAVTVLVLALGFVTTLRVTTTWRDGAPRAWSPRWSRPAAYAFGLDGSRLYLRHLVADRRAVVMAPAALGEHVARINGVDVVYSRTAVPIWRERPAGRLSAGERREIAERFYAELASGRVAGDLLARAGARYVVAPAGVPAGALVDLGPLGRVGGTPLRLYRVAGPAANGDQSA